VSNIRTTIWRVCLVASHINCMDCYKTHQPTSHNDQNHHKHWYMQGRNKVRLRLGQKTSLVPPWSNRCSHDRSLAPPWLNLSSFESKFTVLKKVLVTLLGLFGASCSNSASPQWFNTPIVVNWRPGNCAPLPLLRYTPGYMHTPQQLGLLGLHSAQRNKHNRTHTLPRFSSVT